MQEKSEKLLVEQARDELQQTRWEGKISVARRGSGQRNSAKTYYMKLQKGALIFFDTEHSRNTAASRKPILLRGT